MYLLHFQFEKEVAKLNKIKLRLETETTEQKGELQVKIWTW